MVLNYTIVRVMVKNTLTNTISRIVINSHNILNCGKLIAIEGSVVLIQYSRLAKTPL